MNIPFPFTKRLLRLRTILLVALLSVLLLPLSTLYFFRFYENELVRKTEIELIAQAATLGATFKTLMREHPSYSPRIPSMGTPLASVVKPPQRSKSILATTRYLPANSLLSSASQRFTPIKAKLDLSIDPVLPRREDALKATTDASSLAHATGVRINRIFREAQKITLSGMRLLDHQGIVISGRYELGQSLAHVEEVRDALSGQYASVIRERISDEPTPPLASISRGTGIRLFVAMPVIDRQHIIGVVYLSRTPQNILKHLYEIKGRVFLLGFLLLGVTTLLALFLSTRLSRPIKSLIKQTQALEKGDIETIQVMQQPGTYELAELTKNFSSMSQSLHERSTYIKQFAAHVSHEFKTPLTSMQGAIELLKEHIDDMPEHKRSHFLDNLYDDTQRLKQLVTRLLELAKADSLKPTAASAQLLEVLAALQGHYRDVGLAINYDKTLVMDITLNIDPQALHTVLNNLFENSLQHGADTVSITLENKRDHHLDVVISDNGKGISTANQSKIFTPFFTTRRSSGGTGLGLGIVSSLLKHWEASIRVRPVEAGACFVISW